MNQSLTNDQYAITRRILFEKWRNTSDKTLKQNCVYQYLESYFGLENYSSEIQRDIRKISDNFCVHIKDRWSKSKCTLKYFLAKNSKWLDESIDFTRLLKKASTTPGRGRPRKRKAPLKMFMHCSQKQKRRRIAYLLRTVAQEELLFACASSLKRAGKGKAAKVIQQIIDNPENTKNAFRQPTKMTPEQALALYVECKLTKKQYINIRQNAKLHNADIYPSYHDILAIKKMCYPDNVAVTDMTAEIPLQCLLDHTVKRLITSQSETIRQLRVERGALPNINIIYKWGCDGASGHSSYKQINKENIPEEFDDSCLFTVSLVPLQMSLESMEPSTSDSHQSNTIVWQNPRPSSTRYCRPIKLLFKKETAELVRTEVHILNDQIKNLSETIVTVDDEQLSVHHILKLTMIDGKICAALSNQSTQKCYICSATPKTMNNIEASQKGVPDPEYLSFGLSPLHLYIRSLECILHIAYRLDIKKWKISSKDKPSVDERKKIIQDSLRQQMGLLVDIPKQGCGTTNDGNTARRFFSEPQLVSAITGVDAELINRFRVILTVINCNFESDIIAFRQYTLDTAALYIRLYNWFYMPSSIHKLLMHGAQIIQSALLPIGQFSEEAQEARNKDSKHFREFNTRKFARQQTMEDLLHILLVTSDPLISSYRTLSTKKYLPFSNEILALLKQPQGTRVNSAMSLSDMPLESDSNDMPLESESNNMPLESDSDN